MSLLSEIHKNIVYKRRIKLLSNYFASLLNSKSLVLDVGCGDGLIDSLIMKQRSDISITGVDVLIRKKTYIPVIPFDGNKLPYDSNSFDAIIFIDVLHHTNNPILLLEEAKRVSKNLVIIKDHTKEGFFANETLRLMDWFGNVHQKVSLPYNYWTLNQWHDCFNHLGLEIKYWNSKLNLYPFPARWVFDRTLHFIAITE